MFTAELWYSQCLINILFQRLIPGEATLNWTAVNYISIRVYSVNWTVKPSTDGPHLLLFLVTEICVFGENVGSFSPRARERAFKIQAWRGRLSWARTGGLTSLRRPGSPEPLVLLAERWENQTDIYREINIKMTVHPADLRSTEDSTLVLMWASPDNEKGSLFGEVFTTGYCVSEEKKYRFCLTTWNWTGSAPYVTDS